MARTAVPGTPARPHSELSDWAAALTLFAGTAAVVLWQNSRLAVLWDLSYILENSYRISLGQIPYRDFPFPYAPGTFLVQALLIRLTGRVFFHHVLYCAIVGGAGTVLTWRVLADLLRRTFSSFRLLAFLLALPLAILGIYCVFPHPFYDPDCTFVILVCVFLLLRFERKGLAPLFAFLTGIVCVVPVFIKQNTGLAFFTSVALAMIVLLAVEARRQGRRVASLASLLAGMAAGLAAAALLLHLTVGLHNYGRWTMTFAASRRLPGVGEMLAPFENALLLVWLPAFGAGTLLLHRNRDGKKWLGRLALLLLAVPFAWPVIYLSTDADVAERAEQLLALWPLLLIASIVLAARSLRRGVSITRLLPFVLISSVAGGFLSQQLWGSTYALWPILMILFAFVLAEVFRMAGERAAGELKWFAGITAACVLIAGSFYVESHERLDYADVATGEMAHSSLLQLRGLSMRGPWIPDFEELVRFSDRAIPRGQGLLMIPGEDLFYYTTGRRPQFPVLMFDHTVNPYSPEEVSELARARNICWLVVKKKLQLGGEPVDDKNRLLGLLLAEYEPVEELANYAVYARHTCADRAK
jgi:hypothetical protein